MVGFWCRTLGFCLWFRVCNRCPLIFSAVSYGRLASRTVTFSVVRSQSHCRLSVISFSIWLCVSSEASGTRLTLIMAIFAHVDTRGYKGEWNILRLLCQHGSSLSESEKIMLGKVVTPNRDSITMQKGKGRFFNRPTISKGKNTINSLFMFQPKSQETQIFLLEMVTELKLRYEEKLWP